MFGSEGLHVFDFDGTLVWSKNFGVLDSGFFTAPEAQWEFASSPIIDDGRLIVLADVQKNSFLAAFDVKTGRELWRTPRQDVPTWSTPAIVDAGGRRQIVVNGWKHTGGYDPQTGREPWRMSGGGDIPIPTPVSGNGLIYLTSAHGDESPVRAIRAAASGDVIVLKAGPVYEPVATNRLEAATLATPAISEGVIYFRTQNDILAFR